MEHDGNGWIRCGQGHRHWGRFGAAGLLLRRAVTDQRGEVLLQHRAVWTADGGTWGLPGGARDSHESAQQAAIREAGEEAGITHDAVAAFDEFFDDHGAGWSYTTVVADLVRPVRLIAQAESEELRWVAVLEVDEFLLHPGFARTWPRLRMILEGSPL
ncbi:MAG TPA: NUDIX hydrolase [Microlunatus sp.]|nr:NUDIX hydrolase [Microlunatus sp.]